MKRSDDSKPPSRDGRRSPVVLIAGATASGKSALALDLARETGALIVNADSMQVYRDLRIVTARPSVEDEAAAEHVLYGHVDANAAYSVASWCEDVGRELQAADGTSRPVLIAGGTGLYFRALEEGLSQIPAIPVEIRRAVREFVAEKGNAAAHEALGDVDPASASRFPSGDTQRIVRALEVHRATGRTLTDWQAARPSSTLLDGRPLRRVVVSRERDEIYRRCDLRFERMLEQGAVDEVRALLERNVDPAMPAMKAVGVREIAGWLDGSLSREEAVGLAQTATRRYAKRQLTWQRGNMISWKVCSANELERQRAELLSFLRSEVLTVDD